MRRHISPLMALALLCAVGIFIYFYLRSQVVDQKTQKQEWKQQQHGEEERVVYFLSQIDKSGSSTLRNVFNDRGKFYGNPRMDDPVVVSEIRRNCGSEPPKQNPRNGTNNNDTTTTTTNTSVARYYVHPFFAGNLSKFPFFWRILNSGVASVESECIEDVIDSSWKFWQGAVDANDGLARAAPASSSSSLLSSSSTSVGRQRRRYPKPVVQSGVSCPPSPTAKNNVKCRRLLQMRDPISWIESSFGYFCMGCKDKEKFCGKVVDAKCGPKHRKIGDHETIQSWARKFGNIFTRKFLYYYGNGKSNGSGGDVRLLAGGTYGVGPGLGFAPDGWKHPDILQKEHPDHVHEILQTLRKKVDDEEGYHCIVALEDPHWMSKLETCLGDPPGFYRDKLNITEHTKANVRKEKNNQLGPNVTAELREILAPDISLYNALFPFLLLQVDDAD